jgi:imidazolonepropionase-like amidohydrolase
MRTIIRNGNLLDTTTMSFVGERTIVIEDELVVSVGEDPGKDADIELNAAGKFVLPGFIDAHVHFRLATMDFRRLAQWSEVEFGIAMARLARQTLERGFTTVRDLGGEVRGLMGAIKSGAAQGPRIFHAGRMLTQTGGHGDAEGGDRPVPDCACQMPHTAFSIIADGADAVRKAARHNLRDGSDFLKIHVSGGVASPSDPLDSVQYTVEEVRAATQEANNRNTYVAAHAYTPEAIRLAVENGVKTIEHGNLLNKDAAKLMAKRDAVLVPTLSTYEAMHEVGQKLGLPEANLRKNTVVYEAGLAREFAIRAEVESASDILHSMYHVNAALCRMEGKAGVLAPGAFGDVVIANVNPLDDIRALAQPENTIATVLKGGMPIN